MQATEELLSATEAQVGTVVGEILKALAAGDSPEQELGRAFMDRGVSLWHGLSHAARGPSGASAEVVLRALLELSITARWVLANPAVHGVFWKAASSYNAIARLGVLRESGLLSQEAYEVELATHVAVASEAERLAAQLEADGCRPGWFGAKASRAIPSVADRARHVGLEYVYQRAYGPYSDWTHAAYVTFRIPEEAPGDLLAIGFEGVAAMALLLHGVSHALDVDAAETLASIEGTLAALNQ